MGKLEREWINLDDGKDGRLYAIWSRSGKRLVVTIMRSGSGVSEVEAHQVSLRPEQVEELITFLSESVARTPDDR